MRPIVRLLLSALLLVPLLARSVPSTLTYQGRLFSPSGQPRAGTPTIVFKLFDHETAGEERWKETIANVPLTNGFYSLTLGQNGTAALDDVIAAKDSLWMELTVDGTTLAPRQPLTTMPSALRARSFKGGIVEAKSVTVAGKPIVLKVAGREPDPDTGNVTLSPADVLPTCPTHGHTLKSLALGGFECAADNDGQTLAISGSSLSISNGNSVSLPAATASTLGVVRVGSGLSVDDTGLVTASPAISLSGSKLTIGGTTINLAKAYASACPAGYDVFDQAICEDVNECLTNNGGCPAHQTCTNTVGSRTCATVPGALVTKTLASRSFDFSVVPSGTFMMGPVVGDSSAGSDESPQHSVTISKDFLLLRSETTQDQYIAVMGSNPSNFTGDTSRPVEQVSWTNSVAFCDKLSDDEGVPRGTYRLPREAEWEYAARAGSTDVLYGSIDSIAWYASNSGNTTHPVKQKTRNAWNLYDMLGNVWEWNQDWYGSYAAGSATDPTGPGTGSYHVFRGGSWSSGASNVRASQRGYVLPGYTYSILGFRPLRTLP
jgi:formylglycine-generating enzyme required for sulfatase activity